MENNKVRYKFVTQAQYDGVETKDPNVLYFTSDTCKLYKGDLLYTGTGNAVFSQAVPAFEEAAAKTIYVVLDENSVHLYVKGETEMESITSEVSEGSITAVSAFKGDVLVKSTGELFEDDEVIPTAGAVYKAIESSAPTWETI